MNKTEKQDQDPQLQKTPVSGSRFVPMLFSTEMVKAILNGTKTETRRIINPQPFLNKFYSSITGISEFYSINGSHNNDIKLWNKFAKIKVNDIIWVRETFVKYDVFGKNGIETEIEYKADEPSVKFKWKPSLFMPKDACRIFLKCVSVHVERLQDIDKQSAINEGINEIHKSDVAVYQRYDLKEKLGTTNPIYSYQTLWQKINGRDSWYLNPFVWVYKFERIERPHDFR